MTTPTSAPSSSIRIDSTPVARQANLDASLSTKPWQGNGERFAILVGRHERHGASQRQTVAAVELAAGARSERHSHRERDESFFVVRGSGRARIGEEEFAVREGDLVFARAGAEHAFANDGQAPLVYLVITTPAWVPEDSHVGG